MKTNLMGTRKQSKTGLTNEIANQFTIMLTRGKSLYSHNPLSD